jgi:hypothetical protein
MQAKSIQTKVYDKVYSYGDIVYKSANLLQTWGLGGFAVMKNAK